MDLEKRKCKIEISQKEKEKIPFENISKAENMRKEVISEPKKKCKEENPLADIDRELVSQH